MAAKKGNFIHIWGRMGSMVGHVSLQLKNGVYVSLWPTEEQSVENVKPKQLVDSHGSDFDNDVIMENNRQPTETIEIKGKLDCDAIGEWWKLDQNAGYNLLNKNCTDAVKEALEMGKLPVDE